MKVCALCEKELSDRAFRKDGRFKDNLSPICHTCRGGKMHSDAAALTTILAGADDHDRLALIARVFGALPTVDIPNVAILAAGGPYFGQGSPPEGDFFTKDDLETIAEQTNKLEHAGELRPPSKLGHSEEQRLLNNSGLPVGDEFPAAGWLTNFRVEEIAGTWKLVTDVKQVPAKLGQILASGGYRTRSVELSRVTSQVTGDTYDGVVTGLAWLGAKAPAVRTLDDVFNLYAGATPKATTKLAVGDVVWEEEDGIMDLLSDLTTAINQEIAPDEPSYMWELWVNDVNLKLNTCTASDWDSDTTWIIGFKIGADNEPVVDAREKWTPSTMKLVEIDAAAADTLGGGGSAPMEDDYSAGARYTQMRREARAKFSERAADTKGMKLSDQQVADYAKAFSLEGEGDDLRVKVEARLTELGLSPAGETEPVVPTPAPAPAAPAVPVALASFSEEQRRELTPIIESLTERAERGDKAYGDRFTEVREGKIMFAIGSGRLNPADRNDWVEFYNANPELASKQLANLPVNPALLLTFGVDEHGVKYSEGGGGDVVGLSAEQEDAYLAATGAAVPGGTQ